MIAADLPGFGEGESAGERECRYPLDLCDVEVIGVRLAYEDLGDGPAILFIDGFDDVARHSTARCGSRDRRRFTDESDASEPVNGTSADNCR
ncbi:MULTISPECIES: hypothetical protein [unclassified Mesorhizobium]|uniref:hypothetical protein n=1 Tax=unclassified Mesorhizobium TaxID=325217 RepID=UPI0019D0DE68|nr:MULTISPECIES: hypothetical protein [unclassified Mesorhizobium]